MAKKTTTVKGADKKKAPAADKGTAKKSTTKGKDNEKKKGGPVVDEPLKKDGKVVLTIDMKLSDAEMIAKSREMISEIGIKETLEGELKSIQATMKGKIAESQKKVDALQELIKSGNKKQVVEAVKVLDYKHTNVLFCKVEINLDEHDNDSIYKSDMVYKTEPFGEWDYQRKLALEAGGSDTLDADDDADMFSDMNEEKEGEAGDKGEGVEGELGKTVELNNTEDVDLEA